MEEWILKELMEKENDAFCIGVATGIKLYERKVVNACKEKTHLMIDGDLYYIQDGRDRLKEMIEKICE